MKFQGSPMKTADLSENVYLFLFFEEEAHKYLATLWSYILLRIHVYM